MPAPLGDGSDWARITRQRVERLVLCQRWREPVAHWAGDEVVHVVVAIETAPAIDIPLDVRRDQSVVNPGRAREFSADAAPLGERGSGW
jgi:hypothetical protein